MAKAKEKKPTDPRKIKGYSHEKMLALLNDDLDKIEKKHALVSSIAPFRRLSSGLLMVDSMTGGGYAPGMNTVSGPEASGKTTLNTHTMHEASTSVDVALAFDAEGAVNPYYTGNIFQDKLKNIFGQRDAKNDEWLIRPKVRYYDDSVIETIFSAMQSVLNGLPDKRYRETDNQWFYVFRNKKDEIALMNRWGLGGTHSKSLYTKTGRYWCPTDNRNLAAAFFIDSYASLLTEDVDDQKSSGDALALDARAFSKFVKRVRNKCRRKGAIIFGTNQLRKIPMAMYGPSEQEPGGEALKFYSDCRFRINGRQSPEPWDKKKGNRNIQIEDSVEYKGRTDEYQWKYLRNIKNKNGPPMLEGWGRVWSSDGDAQAWGFDPVFDTYAYLKQTGQIEGSWAKKTFTIYPDKADRDLKSVRGVKIDWLTFKAWILMYYRKEREARKHLESQVRKSIKNAASFDLRKACFKQIGRGTGVEMFVKSRDAVDDDEDLED